MINDYYKYDERGYAPLHAKDNFENWYKQYYALGANGMIDKLRDEFLSLPSHLRKRKTYKKLARKSKMLYNN